MSPCVMSQSVVCTRLVRRQCYGLTWALRLPTTVGTRGWGWRLVAVVRLGCGVVVVSLMLLLVVAGSTTTAAATTTALNLLEVSF